MTALAMMGSPADSDPCREELIGDMETVYLLEHVHVLDEDDEDVKTIGVYRSEASAKEAIRRLGEQPGFRDHPEGWSISAMRMDQDHWPEGFVTIRPGEE
jgi:hypothetical protein